ncbi:MAG: ribosomal-processing cysteine protease Prp [Spirochaetaceae bacterium]|jgi:uncharacterized protein YsxB (DUF464 family)|nr:ribosomal-processing cysteine protease Prp [Spirochaetaceae bacterium]
MCVHFDAAGVLIFCGAEGHAGAAPAGSDIVCASVSTLMRTMARVITGRLGIEVSFSVPERGRLQINACYNEQGKDFLFAAGIFLFEGLKSLAEEYPEYCTLNAVHAQAD